MADLSDIEKRQDANLEIKFRWTAEPGMNPISKEDLPTFWLWHQAIAIRCPRCDKWALIVSAQDAIQDKRWRQKVVGRLERHRRTHAKARAKWRRELARDGVYLEQHFNEADPVSRAELEDLRRLMKNTRQN